MNGDLVRNNSAYYVKMHRKRKKEQERVQLNEIPLEDYVESMAKYSNSCYINSVFRIKPITNFLEKKQYAEVDKTDRWNYKARLSWVANLNEIDYARYKIGFHMVNKIPTLYKFTLMKNVAKM